jgi:NAD(P)-dependent dehydrogenase (short-subunit alcohol dehydrogenase family)
LTLHVNVNGTLFVAQAAFEYLKENGGTVINLGSDAGLNPFPEYAHYSASKGAVHALTRTLAHEWDKNNIRVNAVLPGIWTEMYEEHRASMTADELQHHDQGMARKIPLGGKLANPADDLAPVMHFLTSDAAKFMTAQLVCVNVG